MTAGRIPKPQRELSPESAAIRNRRDAFKTVLDFPNQNVPERLAPIGGGIIETNVFNALYVWRTH